MKKILFSATISASIAAIATAIFYKMRNKRRAQLVDEVVDNLALIHAECKKIHRPDDHVEIFDEEEKIYNSLIVHIRFRNNTGNLEKYIVESENMLGKMKQDYRDRCRLAFIHTDFYDNDSYLPRINHMNDGQLLDTIVDTNRCLDEIRHASEAYSACAKLCEQSINIYSALTETL